MIKPFSGYEHQHTGLHCWGILVFIILHWIHPVNILKYTFQPLFFLFFLLLIKFFHVGARPYVNSFLKNWSWFLFLNKKP